MGYHIHYSFEFGLRPDSPPEADRVFEALARGRTPDVKDLEAFDPDVRTYFHGPAYLSFHEPKAGSQVFIYSPTRASHLASEGCPSRFVRFDVDMTDDGYANGGYKLVPWLFDLVGHNGLFCLERTDLSTIEHYYREFDDLLIVKFKVPEALNPMAMMCPLPMRKHPSWTPARAEDFVLSDFLRIGPEERREVLAM